MDRTQILDVLRVKAKELLDIDPSRITEDASFVRDLDVDSLDLVEYTMALEDTFGVELPDEELSDVEDIGSFVNLIEGKLAAKGAA